MGRHFVVPCGLAERRPEPDSRPVSMSCRIDSLVLPEMVVEVDAWVVIGAHKDIESFGPGDSI